MTDGSATTASDPASTSTTTTKPLPTTTQVEVTDVPLQFPRMGISVGNVTYQVAVADTRDLRRLGLMNVEDLGTLDGMIFVYGEEIQVGHWMKDTLIPLDIAYFDGAGNLVSFTTMIPCEVQDCPTYPAAGPSFYAVEVAAGVFDALAADARLELLEDLPGPRGQA